MPEINWIPVVEKQFRVPEVTGFRILENTLFVDLNFTNINIVPRIRITEDLLDNNSNCKHSPGTDIREDAGKFGEKQKVRIYDIVF